MTRVILISVLMMAPMITMAQSAEDDPCGAAGFQGLVGQTRDIADMLVLEQTMRVITPGSLVTADYELLRINFDVDEDNIIRRISCG